MKKIGIGKIALQLALSDEDQEAEMIEKYEAIGYALYKGKAGSMDSQKIFAAIETAAMRQDLIRENYREEHALYHCTMEAFNGYCRGQIDLGNVLRSTGLVFSIVRGHLISEDKSTGEWLAITLYGQIGSPRQGFEHEAVGMGIQPV
ncbi:MAG: hut operon transcriptional regulator HutP [Tissierellales bacterium]|nr:hut operon transcriptional regulator HutP [Tissierellales bacterium]MBN2828596.1 hut operon transcriptional regulator HutP [Tissierellales bacterium]